MARSFAFPQEGGIITGERASGIAGVAVGFICLTISAALVTTTTETPKIYAALAVVGVTGVSLIVLLARRRSSAAPTSLIVEPGSPADRPEAPVLPDDEILRFARDVTRPASFDQLQLLIAQQLPLLLGVERAWIVARFGGRQRVILPGAPQGGHEKTEMLFGGEHADWTTFPLMAAGSMVGVLGVEVTGRRLSERAVTIVRAVAPIVAHALVTADSTDRLRETSILDTLTGCATRLHGLERLGIELKRAGRSGAPIAVLMVDLDHFKEVNDRFGHNVGDAVLSAAGRTMLQSLRASDVRCRWGGEEFLIVLPETALEPARQVAEALLKRLVESPVHTNAGTIPISASIGLTLARPGEDDIEALIGRADRALYRAKSDGRGCVRIVLGDLKGAPIGGPSPSAPLQFRERRDPNRPDRRKVPGGGRRKTDSWFASPEGDADSEVATPRRAGDRANRL
jgi:diguanylate cyclase (GGDEF)-like protein